MEFRPLPPPKSNNLSRSNLRELSLSGSGIVSLPLCIKEFVGLSHLDLKDYKQLEEISHLPQNIKEVNARGCKSLVEVHDFVGFLDKLVKLDFLGCFNLKKLPRSFKLRSLELLELEGCTSLEYFPEIECEMVHLKLLKLESIEIQELPSSIIYLIGLEKLFMYGCKGLVRLPNFVNFGNELGHNGQSNNLSWTNNLSSNLRKLILWGSGIVSLPPCIEGFVGLERLDLEDCKQLEEILHLPPNIVDVYAIGCVLLERFPHVSTESSFGIPDLKRLRWIELSECNKVEVDVGNHAPDPLLVQERFREKDSSRILYPASRIPEWFKYCKETASYTDSIEIEIDHNESMCEHKIVALVLCFVVGPLPRDLIRSYTTFTVSINGQLMLWDPDRDSLWLSRDPHRVCLKYIAGNSIDHLLSRSYREGNNMRFTFESLSNQAIFKSAGVHLIYGNDNFIHLNIQLSKRSYPRDDGEHDLEPTTEEAGIFNQL